MEGKATIVLIGSNSLMMIGLRLLLRQVIPFAQVHTYHSVEAMRADRLAGPVFHYFITPSAYAQGTDLFERNHHKTIILSDGDNEQAVPSHYRRLNMLQPANEELRHQLQLQHQAHHGNARYPQEVAEDIDRLDPQQKSPLSAREIEVLRLLAKGMKNKEIADELNISVNTVITHRKNIMQSLQSQSLAKLTIYAVQHDYISPDEIR